jgi:DTW domain-containing protein YfiP
LTYQTTGENKQASLDWEPRVVCERCRRPASVCYCAHLSSIETKTRVLLLQHPRERDMAIGTARMASLCLPNAELAVGIGWDDSPVLARALSDPERPAVLLYPGPGAIDVATNPPAGPVTLIVIDGTWAQAKTMVRKNPRLRELPRYTFVPPAPSEYRIRREPKETYVSTIEALVFVLGALEKDPARFHALLAPFRAMIDAQIDCERRFQGGRTRHAKKKLAGPRAPRVFGERFDDLVCVVGEANAWPYCSRERGVLYEDELVHWVGHRVSTGETFDFVVTPRNPLAPRTPAYVGLAAERLATGGTLDDLKVQWRAFAKESDVVCFWGHYAPALFASSGGYLPPTRVDLRHVARGYARKKVGTLEDFVAATGAPPLAALAEGRAGRRLAGLTQLVRGFAENARRSHFLSAATPD